MKTTEIKLCCGGKGCPVVKKEDAKTIKIKDDYGNTVTLNAKEAKLLKNALEELGITD